MHKTNNPKMINQWMPIMNMASNRYSIDMCEPILYVMAIIYIAPDHVEIIIYTSLQLHSN
jgi:hypothetical protein